MSFVQSPPPTVSNSGEIPTYPWFEEQEASKNSKNQILEMNHISQKNGVDRSVISYGNQNRTDKVGFGVREAVERNGTYLGGRVEKLASEEREKTLMTELDTRAQMSKDFSNVFLTAKQNEIESAANIGEMKTSMLEESLRNQTETIQTSDYIRWTAQQLAVQQAKESSQIIGQETCQIGDLKNHETLNYSKTMDRMEHDFSKVELELADAVKNLEKGAGFLGVQHEQHHGDTNRRMANYREGTDTRLDAFGAAQALLFADLRNSLAVQAANDTAKLEECCCETKNIINEKSGDSDSLLRANEQGQLRDGLAAQEQATLLYKISATQPPCAKPESRGSSRSSHSSHHSHKSHHSRKSHHSGERGPR